LNEFIERKKGRFQPLLSYSITVQKNVGIFLREDKLTTFFQDRTTSKRILVYPWQIYS